VSAIDEPRVNYQIRVPRVKLIGEDGQPVGEIATQDALKQAEAAGLDLVEVAANATPPVCRIMDFGKYKYRLKKKTQKSRAKQHVIHIKEVKLRPTTEEHDYAFKMKHAREFMAKGDKVKITIAFKGREMQHRDLGEKMLQKVIVDLSDVAKVEQEARQMGRFLSAIVTPK
jgi:translation initiation factor IF-3